MTKARIILKAIFDRFAKKWGYLSFEKFTGDQRQLLEIRLKQRMLGGKATYQRCNVCGDYFWALKKNPVCRSIFCLIAYRLKEKRT